MKHFLLILFVLTGLCARAATITGPISLAYSNAPYVGPILFRPLSTPLPYTPTLITGGDFTVRPGTNGTFSVDLQPGNYRVQVGADRAFVIDVPTNNATYTLLERITNSLSWNSAISPRTNSYATANNTIEGVVRTYSTQGAPVAWLTNDIAAMRQYLGEYAYTNIAEMIAAPVPLQSPVIVHVQGYYLPNDGGGGDFIYDAISSASTNYGSSIALTSGAGRMFAVQDQPGKFNVLRFGAVRDGVTSSRVRIQNAITAAYNYIKGTVFFPPGIYRCSITNLENVTLVGNSQQGQKNSGEGASILKLEDGSVDEHVVTFTEEGAIENIQIDGNKANVSGTSYGIFFNRSGIYIESTVEECSVVNAKSAGIYIDAHEITVRNSSVIDSDGYGIYVDDCYDTILQSVLVGWSGNDGVFFGPNGSGSRITSLDSYYSRGNGVTFTSPFGVFVDRLQVDFSFKHGIEIVSNSGSTMIDIGLRFVYASNNPDDGFKGHTNSAASGTYSDICISGSTYPSSIVLQGGRVGSFIGGLTKKAAYSIVWSNSVPEVGWGTRIYDVNMDTISGTRTASGKAADDGWINKYFWQGRIQNYYDGTNNYVLERTTMTDARWDFLAPPPFKSHYGTNSIQDLNVATNLVVGGSGRFGGATAGRDVTTSKLGVQIKSDTGTAFGISNFGDTFYIASESGSNPSWQMKGLNGNTALQSTMAATSGTDKPLKVGYTLNQTSGTAGSTGLSIESTSTAVGSGTHSLFKAIDDGLTIFDMRLDGRFIVKSTNGILPHIFGGQSASDSSLYLNFGQTLDRRMNVDGDSLYVALADGTSANQTLYLNEFGGNVHAGGYIRTASGIEFGSAGTQDRYGGGSPEGVVFADKGSTWRRTDGGASTIFYVKETGIGLNTGWVALGPPGAGGVAASRQILTTYSLTGGGDLSTDRTLSLVNDTASPGANKVYGTDASGVRGWKNDPTGGGGVSDGDKGDITISGSGTVYTVDAGVVTLAKMANLAQDQFIGRVTASTGVPETTTITAAGRALIDDADASAQRTTLGLGSLSTLSAAPAGTLTGSTLASGVTASSLTSVGTITSGTWNGTAISVFYGGTGAGTFTDGGVLIGNGTSAIQSTSAGTVGQVLVSGGAGVDPAFGAVPSHNHAASDITSGTVATARLGSGTANSSTFLRGDQTWQSVSGAGDVVGPASATDAVPVLFDGTTGKLIKNSTPTGTGNPVLATAPTLTGGPTISGGLTLNGSLDMQGGTAGVLSLSVPNNFGTRSLVFPGFAGAANQVMVNDGANQLSWTNTLTDGDKGDITVGSSVTTMVIDNDVVSNAKMANMAASTIKARVTGSTGDPEDATLSQVLDLVGSAANGDILYRTGGSWTRLAKGQRGANLHSDGATLMWKSQRTHAWFIEDFIMSNLPTDWQTGGSGGGAAFVAGETGETGIYSLNTSTSSTGSRLITRGITSVLLGGGEVYVEWRAKIPTLGSGSERFNVTIGLTDQVTTPFDGAVFDYADNVNSGNWVLRTTSNGSSSTSNTSTAADTGWHVYGILVNAGATQVDFYIDDTNVGNITGTIPTGAARNTAAGASITKSVGSTQRDLYLGYVMLEHKFTTAR